VALNVALELFDTPFTREVRPFDDFAGAVVEALPPLDVEVDVVVELLADPELHAATARPAANSKAAPGNVRESARRIGGWKSGRIDIARSP
jgi:hypothetical protein